MMNLFLFTVLILNSLIIKNVALDNTSIIENEHFKKIPNSLTVTKNSNNNESCDTENSCNVTTVTVSSTTEIAIIAFNSSTTTTLNESSSKWKYDVESGSSEAQNLTIELHLNASEINMTQGILINTTMSPINETDLKNENKKRTNTKFILQLNTPCKCDEKKGSCDMNCCCDHDCITVNRDIFENCTYAAEDSIDQYCTSKLFNSEMFCVVRDNLYSKHFYPNKRMVEQVIKINRLLNRNDVFGWSLPTNVARKETAGKNSNIRMVDYTAGSQILFVVNNSILFPFVLPNSIITSQCRIDEPVLYVKHTKRSCEQYIHQMTDEWCKKTNSPFNAEYYYRNITVVVSPHLINTSATNLNCSKNCILITPFVCKNGNLEECKIVKNNTRLNPVYNAVSKTCHNTVASAFYEIFHNGVEGIKSINVYFEFQNLTPADFKVEQIFEVSFQWQNQSNYFERSGFPGYLQRKPIISGSKNLSVQSGDVIIMSPEASDWMTIFQPAFDNKCHKMSRRNILFKQNIYAHCYINVSAIKSPEMCEQFQNEIIQTVIGPNRNISNWYISAFGDPDVTDINKWAPVLFQFPILIFNETCSNLIKDFKIDILYSVTGEYHNPQDTIFGVTITGQAFEATVTKFDVMKISVAVNFYDITHQPLRIFAEPPTYEVKLPPDFFYPFFSNGIMIKCGSLLKIFLTLELIFLITV